MGYAHLQPYRFNCYSLASGLFLLLFSVFILKRNARGHRRFKQAFLGSRRRATLPQLPGTFGAWIGQKAPVLLSEGSGRKIGWPRAWAAGPQQGVALAVGF
jgi:hypothetical protein